MKTEGSEVETKSQVLSCGSTLYKSQPPTWVANQPVGTCISAYEMQNLVYEWVDFSKFSQT